MAEKRQDTIRSSTAQELPNEILLLIFESVWNGYDGAPIDHFYDPAVSKLETHPPLHYNFMSDLCRVRRSWLPSARTILYKHPIVTSTKRLTAISRTLSSLPQIGRSVKGISIGIVYDRSYDLSITSVTTITIELLSTLANLRALCLEGVAARAIPSKTFLECSSALTTLCLHDMALTPHAVSLIPSGLKCLTMQDVSVPCDTVFPRLPILHTLRLKGYVAGESISRQLFAQCPALDCLVLRDSCGKGMMQILAPLAPRIRKLWMHNVLAPVNSCMEDMPHLQELEIDESYMYKQVDWLPRALQTLKLRWLPIYYLQPLFKRLLDARRFPNLVSVPQIEIEWHLSERHHDLTELARRVLAHPKKIAVLVVSQSESPRNSIWELANVDQ